MAELPWLKFYPTDWRSDPALRMCSMAARGLWIEMIALMHEATPYGHLLVSGRSPTDTQLAVLVGAPSEQIPELLGELDAAGVFSRTKEGVIFSRKMTRTAKKAAIARKNGKKGGNPTLCNNDDNPPSDKGQDKGLVKTQRPEARGQSLESSSSNRAKGEDSGRAPQHAALPLDGTFREQLIVAAGGHPSGINPATGRPTSIGDAADMLAVAAWKSDLGLTDLEIVAVIRDGAERKKGAPASKLRFFDGHMQDFAAEKRKRGFSPISKPEQPLADPEAEAERLSLISDLGSLRGSNSDAAFAKRAEIITRLQAIKAAVGA